ncbi:MAG: PP2C family protein-serine/threonine phosphatase [Spirochaetes bacterium]|nr:PP2C family protein-serine/threonine phosphatase [Spirochaetota bacterium]
MARDDRIGGEIGLKYAAFMQERTFRYSRLAGWFSLSFPVLYVIWDPYLVSYPVNSGPWRLMPLVFGMTLLVFVLTPLRKHKRIISIIYYLFLASLMVMMCGLVIIYMRFHIIDTIITGMVTVIFAIHFASMGGYRYLLPIYALPFAATVAYILVAGDPTKQLLVTLSNPIVMIIVACVSAEIQERFRFREFLSRQKIEASNRELTDKNRVIETNNVLFQEQLGLARTIQLNLIPRTTPELSGLDIHSVYMPLYEIGGDLYDYIYFKEQNLFGIFIADVTGHGVPAALITSMVKTLANMSGKEKLSPGDFLHYLNDKIMDMGNFEFITAFYAIYDSDTMTLRYARAGHCMPYLIRGHEVLNLTARGMLLGVNRGQIYQEKSIPLRPLDKLIFYTDGLIEAENEEGIQFSEILHHDLKVLGDLPIRDLVNRVYSRLIDFVGKKKFEDDVCIVGIQIR